ncbi:MAG: hypothetical protein O7H41_02780 [Planctomycetota bacterium]|nr:hypothetical protein [Planctomycetota bacterium]
MPPEKPSGKGESREPGDGRPKEFIVEIVDRVRTAWDKASPKVRQRWTYGGLGALAFLVLLVVVCSDGQVPDGAPGMVDDDRRTMGFVNIDGVDISFTDAVHTYESEWEHTKISLDASNPPGWEVSVIWDLDEQPHDIRPGASGLTIVVKRVDPSGAAGLAGTKHYHSDRSRPESVLLEVKTFVSEAGGYTSGTFSGRAYKSDSADPDYAIELLDGRFTAVRR